MCVLVHQFPVRSETFIVDHVAGLIERGHHVTVIPLTPRPTDAWEVPPRVDEIRRRTAPSIAPPPASGAGRAVAMAGLVARAARNPRVVVFARDAQVVGLGGFGRGLLFAERFVAAGPFDVVHAQFATTAAAAVGLRRHGLTTAPIVCSVHGQDVNTMDGSARARFVALVPEIARITVGTSFMRDVVVGFGVDENSVTVWPQGVEIGPAIAHVSSDAFRVLAVGRLVPFKGVDDALRVIATARTSVPNLVFQVVGDGPERPALERLAAELGVADITTFSGGLSHDAVLEAHARADVFLHMARVAADGATEGQGVAPAEASANGVPIVATRAGGLPEVVIDGQTGLLVPIGDVAGAAKALVALAFDQKRRIALGEAGRRFVAAEYLMSRSVDRVLGIYSETFVRNPD